jgi:hypothetical protein
LYITEQGTLLQLALNGAGRELRGKEDGSDLTNVQYNKPNQSCHYESPLVQRMYPNKKVFIIKKFLLFPYFFVCFWDRISPSNTGCPQTPDLLASAFWVLRLQAWVTIPQMLCCHSWFDLSCSDLSLQKARLSTILFAENCEVTHDQLCELLKYAVLGKSCVPKPRYEIDCDEKFHTGV